LEAQKSFEGQGSPRPQLGGQEGGGALQLPFAQDWEEQSLSAPQAIPGSQLGEHQGTQAPFRQRLD
jgi:hypothetical protein